MNRIFRRTSVRDHALALFKASSAAVVLAAICSPKVLSALGPVDPVALVRRASHNEVDPENSNNQAVRYKLRKSDEKGVTTKEIVESKDGGVARLIAINDQALTAQQQRTELERLDNLLAHPELQEHRRKREKEDSDRATEMVRLLPDAFLYKYEGMVSGTNGPAYRLSFRPNPTFDPPDHEAQVYHGMVGKLWIDKAQERMVRLDAHLVEDVDFGWGILGKLYKGGSILVVQADVGHRHWEATHMQLNLVGKALLFKSLNFTTTEDSTDFEPVPKEISYRDAVRMLEATQASPPGSANGR